MPDLISNDIIDDAVAQALQLSLSFLDGPGRTRHVPFTFTPAIVSARELAHMETAAALLGRLTQALAANPDLIQRVHRPLATGDPFFAAMLDMHEALSSAELLRLPLLLQRSDFMIDATGGPRLVECNSIAAGMAPFGEQVGALHAYIRQYFPREYDKYFQAGQGRPVDNPATPRMASALLAAMQQVATDLDDDGPLSFLMVVQENEDNLFDQRLLEQALHNLGVQTHRRTFRQLHRQLSSGRNNSLQLEGGGTVHAVYLRAGYQYADYVARDLDSKRCCDALQDTRLFIERHRVAVNATVAQQLATSKRMQLALSDDGGALLSSLGFDADEIATIRGVLARMETVDAGSAQKLRNRKDSAEWVLKNQGEGGGHCLFDDDIIPTLDRMEPAHYDAWTLMQRLRPAGRAQPTLLLRNARATVVERLVSEIGVFTANLGNPALATGATTPGHIGYLVRSKPPNVSEGGVHSGYGALDSLFIED